MNRNLVLELIELRLALMQHGVAIRQALELRRSGKEAAAWARLDGALTTLHCALKTQAVGLGFKCPECKSKSSVNKWSSNCGNCPKCGYSYNDRKD